ncbi:MAG: hypothetical protein S0880_13235 [Actinomycetota bacterium]|nr:hypothetical protein [Actinomycetota bacterium]
MLTPEDLRQRASSAADDAEDYDTAARGATRVADALADALRGVVDLHTADVWDSRAATGSRDRLTSLDGLLKVRSEQLDDLATEWRRRADDLQADATCFARQAAALEVDDLRGDTCDDPFPAQPGDSPFFLSPGRLVGTTP